MTREEVNDWLFKSEDEFDYSKYELLANLICVFENEEESFEVVFAVPAAWLVRFLELKDYISLDKWFREYTSEDSQQVLEQAVIQNKIAFWKIC